MRKFQEKQYGFISSVELNKKENQLAYWLIFAFALFIVAGCMLPPLWIILSSFKDTKEFFSIPATFIPRTFHPEKVVEVWQEIDFAKYFINSLTVVAGAVFCAVFINSIVAYAISMLRPKGSRLVYTMILVSLMIPNTVAIMPLFKSIVDFGMMNTYYPLIFASGANAFFVILFKQFYDDIPISYLEAAKIDGASDFRVFIQIITPMSKPVNVVVMIFALNAAWSDFLLPYLVLRDKEKMTVMVKLFTLQLMAEDRIIVALLFTIVPPVILFLFFQKYMIQGIAAGGIKG